MSADVRGTIPLERSGWCLLRAYADKDEEPVFDAYPYATTSAIYVSVAGRPAASGEDAAYFVRWIDRMTDSARANAAWNSDAEKQSVKETLQRARAVYAAMEK
jgi:arylsulfatase A-like enzyme